MISRATADVNPDETGPEMKSIIIPAKCGSALVLT